VQLIETYKTHRTQPGSVQQEADKQLNVQVPIAYRLLELCGIAVMGHPGYEAEDVIGTLARRSAGRVAIVSGDRDLFQLVRDPDVFVLYPKRGVSVVDRVDEGYIEERFHVPGRAYRDYAVLRGDSSDGLPGVRGIGEKMAASLISRHGSLDGVIAAAERGDGIALERVRRDLDYVRRATQVVTIATDLPLPQTEIERPHGEVDESVLSEAERFGLRGALGRLLGALRRARG
ncbi:MAG TPA: 5'-3' exonuclease H3TH domain-containing protein, partial [Actinomycetota bacterium]|nr:5'-3' exonuclease H3TH domain-containing protein [Actinomycetota bacterium]